MMKFIILLLFFIYAILFVRYYLKYSDDDTLYIEKSENSNIRLDNKLTLYESPASKYMHHLSIIESKLHRSSRSRAFICTSPSRIFAIKPNADIPAEWTPTFYPNIDPFKETSPIDVFDLNFEKFPQNVEIIEIPMSKNQILFIPRGWFIQFENVNDFNILLMKS